MMKISINLDTNDVIDVMGIAWLKSIRDSQQVNIDNAFLVEDATDSERLINAIDQILEYLGVYDDESI